MMMFNNTHTDIQKPPYKYKTFLLHKPLGVVSSKIDSKVNDVIRNINHPRYGEKTGGIPRATVYDLVGDLGFPTNCGLVGRLDFDTSGIILFSNDRRLADAIRDPVKEEEDSILYHSPFKQKIYELCLLSPHKYESIESINPQQIINELSQPLDFNRGGIEFHTQSPVEISIVKIEQNYNNRGDGRLNNMGWTILLKIIIKEGKHHQIRRMAKRSKYHIISLKRIQIASILSIDSVPQPGDCRWLTEIEIQLLYQGLLLGECSAVTDAAVDDENNNDDDQDCVDSLTIDDSRICVESHTSISD